MAAAFRLLALVALVLTSWSMTAGPAFAHPASEAAVSGGCEEHPARDQAPAAKSTGCAAACAALPALDTGNSDPLAVADPPGLTAHTELPIGINPKVATPPPKTV